MPGGIRMLLLSRPMRVQSEDENETWREAVGIDDREKLNQTQEPPGERSDELGHQCCCGKEGIRQANLSAGKDHLPDDGGNLLPLFRRRM
jgi:hypothetical protein